MSGDSQLLVTPATGDPTPSPGLIAICTCAHTLREGKGGRKGGGSEGEREGGKGTHTQKIKRFLELTCTWLC